MNINQLKRDALTSRLQAYGSLLIWAENDWTDRLIFNTVDHAIMGEYIAKILGIKMWDAYQSSRGVDAHVFKFDPDTQLAWALENAGFLNNGPFQIIFDDPTWPNGLVKELPKRKPT